mmetsp:Transcript_24869/g.74346  ORF Transcript_24869/g.74346 Transcript_24869/m.74346 type:complete len:213 (-) Transcript_24869:202-840(-)
MYRRPSTSRASQTVSIAGRMRPFSSSSASESSLPDGGSVRPTMVSARASMDATKLQVVAAGTVGSTGATAGIQPVSRWSASSCSPRPPCPPDESLSRALERSSGHSSSRLPESGKRHFPSRSSGTRSSMVTNLQAPCSHSLTPYRPVGETTGWPSSLLGQISSHRKAPSSNFSAWSAMRCIAEASAVAAALAAASAASQTISHDATLGAPAR